MAELRASPVVNPSYKRIADVLANLQGPMGQIIPFTDANPFKFLMPAASTFENLAYGNAPLAMPPGVTNRRLPIVKTGREGEFTDLASLGLLATGVPQVARGAMQGANYLGDVLTQARRAAPPAAPMRAVSEIAEAAPITPKPLPPEPVKSDIGFYSQLEAATNPLQDKGTGDQFLSQLQKSAGVKPDEIKYTGLDEFLKGKKAVTKAEIQGYLASNKVDVQEVRLDRSLPVVQAERRGAFEAYDRGEITLEQRNAILEQSEAVNTRYHLGALKNIDTEIPGGENYRELLLTLPQKGGVDVKAAEQTRDTLARQTADLMEEWKRLSEEMPGDPRVVELYGRLSETRRARDQAVVDARELRKAAESQTYRTTHFDQPNILAHMRVNDRVVDGKKTLFIEEIQSDWHQAGRKKGYAGADTKNAEAAFRQYSQELADKYNLNPEQNLSMYETMKGMQPEEVAKYDELQSAWVSSKGGVPDAPFKTSWHELTLKRAIQEASEKGYDQIAFTTGKTQAERYDLSKQVNSLQVMRNIDGNYSLGIKRTDADSTFEPLELSVPQSELSDYIGKDLAQKITEDGSGSRYFSKVYSGLDLQIGGEGMKGFYDQILPKSLEKLGKKFDAKVGKTQMDGVEVWQMDITPKMRESVTTKGSLYSPSQDWEQARLDLVSTKTTQWSSSVDDRLLSQVIHNV
jgi:hypothetical protein